MALHNLVVLVRSYLQEYPYIVLLLGTVKSVEWLGAGIESYIDLRQGQEARVLYKTSTTEPEPT
jgi:hypothetical protein